MSNLCTCWLTCHSSYIIYKNLARPPWGREGLLFPSIYIYILHFSAAASEGFAPDLVLNFVGDSGRLPFPGFVLAFSITFLEGRARRAPTGVLPCPHLGVSSHRRARQPRTGGICAGERRHGRSIFFPPGKLVRCSCSAKTFL